MSEDDAREFGHSKAIAVSVTINSIISTEMRKLTDDDARDSFVKGLKEFVWLPDTIFPETSRADD